MHENNDHIFRFSKEAMVEKRLELQALIDNYKDDLISTLEKLLESKEALIAEMRERGEINNK